MKHVKRVLSLGLALLAAACATASTQTSPDDPEIAPRTYDRPLDAVYQAAVAFVRETEDWELKEERREAGELHAVHITATLRFRDDVVLTFTEPAPGKTHVEGVSSSRIGYEDFGQNRRNLAEILAGLDARLAE